MSRQQKRAALKNARSSNNRKHTRGRRRQYVPLKNGKVKVIVHPLINNSYE